MVFSSKQVGKNLKDTRKKLGKLQKDVSADLFIDPSYLSAYECGRRTPSLEFIARIAEYYGVSVDYLIYGIEFEPDAAGADNDTPGTLKNLSDREIELLEYFNKLSRANQNIIIGKCCELAQGGNA